MLTRDEVIWAFRYCFGRDPESEETVTAHSGFKDWAELRQALLGTTEYASLVSRGRFAERWVMAPVMGGARVMWLDLGDRYVSQGCLVDDYESIESAFVREHVKPDGVFLDIGANIGWFTLLASTLVGPEGSVHAFEPRPPTVTWLKRTIEANRLESQVTVHDFALAAQDGEAFINWARDTDNPGGSFVSDSPLSDGMESRGISVRALDSLDLGRVDFIKMDVEGSEMNVVFGGARTIFGSRPVILTEINPRALAEVSKVTPDELLAFFQARGYRASVLDPERGQVAIDRFPPDWPREFANIGLFPS